MKNASFAFGLAAIAATAPATVHAQPVSPMMADTAAANREANAAFQSALAGVNMIKRHLLTDPAFKRDAMAASARGDTRALTSLFVAAGATQLKGGDHQIEMIAIGGRAAEPFWKTCWGKGKWYGGCLTVTWKVEGND